MAARPGSRSLKIATSTVRGGVVNVGAGYVKVPDTRGPLTGGGSESLGCGSCRDCQDRSAPLDSRGGAVKCSVRGLDSSRGMDERYRNVVGVRVESSLALRGTNTNGYLAVF